LVKIRRVIVDAGHGGHDTGALGKRGTREKDVNLAIALRLGHELQHELGVEVIYTRKTDVFVPLSRRAEIANRANADLFISVHSNAHKNRDISGVETYFLNTTSSHYASRLASRENAEQFSPDDLDGAAPDVGAPEDDAGQLPGGPLGRDLRLLLADLAMRSATDDSRRLASYVQGSVVGSLRRSHTDVKDLGVKHALFYVLLGVRMPSVLVESGFLTHREEESRLAEPRYQETLASAIARGVRRFIEERNQVASRN
jgi:N-acetylmuramoyl-L-alanine amidase